MAKTPSKSASKASKNTKPTTRTKKDEPAGLPLAFLSQLRKLRPQLEKYWKNLQPPELPFKFPAKIGPFRVGEERGRGALAWLVVLVVALVVVVLFGNQIILAYQKQTSAAIVNGDTITKTYLEHRLLQAYGSDTVQSIVDETLILQEGDKQKALPSKDEIDQQIKSIEQQVAPQKLDDALSQRHLTRDDITRTIKVRLTVQKILGKDISITDADIQKYFDDHKDTLAQTSGKSAADLKLEDVKSTVVDALKNEMISSKYQPWIDELRSKANIKTFI